MMKLCALIPAGVVIFGCVNEDPLARVAMRADSSGVELVANSGSDQVLSWKFERVLTLGGADAGPESFYQVSSRGLTFDPHGRIYVLDTGNRRVQVFGGSGELIRTVGRQGDGPGEFQGPSSVAVDSLGMLIVHDFPRRAMIRFDSSGVYLDQQPAARGIFGPVRVDGGSHLFATRTANPEGTGMAFRLYRATAADTVELARIPLSSSRSIHYESCGVSISLPPLFDNEPTWDADNGRLALTAGPEYAVRIFESGAEVRQVRRVLEPETATLEHAARELAEGEEWLIGGRPCTVPLNEVVEKRGIAEWIPLIARVTLAPDGWLWVQRKAIGVAGAVDIFDATGEYIGTLPPDTPWPAGFGPSEQILVLEEDELEVQRVAVYRVRRN